MRAESSAPRNVEPGKTTVRSAMLADKAGAALRADMRNHAPTGLELRIQQSRAIHSSGLGQFIGDRIASPNSVIGEEGAVDAGIKEFESGTSRQCHAQCHYPADARPVETHHDFLVATRPRHVNEADELCLHAQEALDIIR